MMAMDRGNPPATRPQPDATPPSPPPDLPAAEVLAAYRGILPWSLITGVAAALLPGPAGQQLLLGAGASPFLVAAAVRGMGLHRERTVLTLAVERAFTHLTSLLPLILFAALAAAIGGTVGAMIADAARLPDPRPSSLPLAALFALPILWRRWPALVLAYVVPEAAGFRRPGARAWRGPRYGDARILSHTAGSPRSTAIILGFLFLWAFVLITAGDYAGDAPLPSIVRAASYVVFLPLLVAMAAVETHRMVSAGGLEG